MLFFSLATSISRLKPSIETRLQLMVPKKKMQTGRLRIPSLFSTLSLTFSFFFFPFFLSD